MGKMRRFFSFRLKAKMGLVILSLLLFNLFAVSFGSSFLREKLPFLANKSEKFILSDLLFIEGAVILAIGALAASSASVLRKKQFAFGIILIIVGATLVGLSIAVSAFL